MIWSLARAVAFAADTNYPPALPSLNIIPLR
jgi:hypothetical protein